MKANWIVALGGVLALAMILLTGYQAVAAAPPTGEVKTVAAMFGNQIPIPFLETGVHSSDWMQLLYDHLLGCTPEGKLSPDHGLAKKWELSPDGLTWTFYLREGVKFHDGVELTAKDVKFTVEQVMRPDSLVGDAGFMRENVKSIEVKGLYTLTIHTKRPCIFLDGLLSNSESSAGMIIPKDYYERVGKEEFAKHPIGSGPYRFHSQRVGSFIKLEATARHWRDGVPKYKYMTYLIISEESTRMAMLRTGEADIARISREAVKEALNSGLSVITRESSDVLIFLPNMQWATPAFSDVRFRKALNLAIDKEAIIKHIFSGLGKPLAAFPGSRISVFGGDPTLKPYPYAPEEAKRLVNEGGWTGHEFNLISFDRAGCPEFPRVVEAIAGYWEKIGLKPKIRISEWPVFRRVWADRKTQNTVHGFDIPTSPELGSLLTRFAEWWYFYEAAGRSTVNIPVLNEKFETIEKSKNAAEIAKLLSEIYRYVYDHYLSIPICEISDMVATTKRIPKWNLGKRRSDRNYYDLIKQ